MGRSLGRRWVIDEVLGDGAMGIVYRAHHRVLQRPVAVKVLRPELSSHEAVAARFLREAKAASKIDSPYVVDIIDFGREGDTSFIVMELLAGRSLEVVLEAGAMPLPMVYDLAIALADGFSSAHAAGVVHRDIKPGNVVLLPQGDGTFGCKIVDFGIAKVRTDICSARLTTPGLMIGTPYYMSPEHCSGEDVDHRSDIYSLGAMLYELVVGRPPFDGEMLSTIIAGHLARVPTPIRNLVPECPMLLADAIMRCMEKTPEERFASMTDLRLAFERARDAAFEGTTRRSSIRPVAPMATRSKPRRSMQVGVGAAIAALGAAWLALIPPSAPVTKRALVDANEAMLTSHVAAAVMDKPPAAEPVVAAAPKKKRKKKAAAPASARQVAAAPPRAPTDVVDPWE